MRLKYSFATILLFTIYVFHNALIYGQFSPAAGQQGSTAIHKDSSIIVAWATGIEVTRGLINISNPEQSHEGSNFASFGVPENALGPASGTSEDVVSLGDGGIATLSFELPIINGEGFDFCVFENAFTDHFLELAHVEVSSDGVHFVRFPSVSLTQTATQIGPFGSLDPTKIHNLAGKYRQGFGTPFDLDDLIDSSGIDLNNITHVRLIDVVGSIDPQFGTTDSEGNIINDLFPTPFYSSGFDLDAVGVIHEGTLSTIQSESMNVFIYPNPSKGHFYIRLHSDEAVTLQLFDASGQEIPCNSNQENQLVQISKNLKPGVYFIKIIMSQNICIERLIVN